MSLLGGLTSLSLTNLLDDSIKFIPTQLSGLVEWLRADKGVTASNNDFPNGSTFETYTLRQVSVPITNGSDPDGGTSARKILADGANNLHYLYKQCVSVGWSVGTVVTATVYLKYIDTPWLWVATDLTYGGGVYVNVQTGTVGTVIGTPAISLVAVSGGWYRLVITFTSPVVEQYLQLGIASGDGSIGPMVSSGSFWTYNASVDSPEISTWADQSAVGDSLHNVVGAASKRPKLNSANASYNNKPTVEFSGANSMHSGIWSTPVPAATTVFLVGHSNDTVYADHHALAGGLNGEQYVIDLIGSTNVGWGRPSFVNAVNITGTNNNSKHIYTMIDNGTQSKVLVDNIELLTGNCGVSSPNAITVGASYADSVGLNGSIAEVIIYNRVLTASERLQVSRYLSNRYAIAIKQPSHGPTAIPDCAAWYRADLGVTQTTVSLTHPLDFEATTLEAITIPVTNAADPLGGTAARQLRETNANTHHDFTSTFSAYTYAGQPSSISIYAKADGRDWCWLQLGASWYTFFDLANIVVGTKVGTGNTSTIVDAGNGWRLITVSAAADTGSNIWYFGCANADNGYSYTGDVTKGVIAYGASLTARTTVSAWADQSGNGDSLRNLAQATGSNQPLFVSSDAGFNSQATLSFDGANPGDYMETGVWNNNVNQAYSWFVVAKYTDDSIANGYVFDSRSGTQSGMHQSNSGGTLMFYAGIDISLTFDGRNKFAAFIAGNGASGKKAVNTTTVGSGLNFGTDQINGGICVGNYSDGNGSGSFCFKGQMAELAVFDRVLTDAEVATLMNYAATRYGITLV